jgi:hypothetical protein
MITIRVFAPRRAALRGALGLLLCLAATGAAAAQKNPGMPPAAEHGYFRIRLIGFVVHAPTLDTALGLDGSGDEVSVRADLAEVDARVSPVSYVPRVRHIETPVMGDTHNPEFRILAGSASPTGGLTNNDEVPRPSSLPPAVDPEHARLPLVVWEGELTRGRNGVVVIPSLWEWDGPGGLKGQWVAGLPEWFGRFVLSAADQLSGGSSYTASYSDGRISGERPRVSRPIPNILNAPADRPIGMSQSNGYESFSAQGFLFTYSTASSAATEDRSGRGPGVIELRYDDGGSLLGSYSLFMTVQRIR